MKLQLKSGPLQSVKMVGLFTGRETRLGLLILPKMCRNTLIVKNNEEKEAARKVIKTIHIQKISG